MKMRQSKQKAKNMLLVLIVTEMIEMPVIVPEIDKSGMFASIIF